MTRTRSERPSPKLRRSRAAAFSTPSSREKRPKGGNPTRPARGVRGVRRGGVRGRRGRRHCDRGRRDDGGLGRRRQSGHRGCDWGGGCVAVAIAGGNVAVGLAVGRPTEHPAEPIVLVSIVTAPFQASARPDTLAPVVKLTLLSARKVTIVVCIDHQLPGVAESKQRAADQSDEDERREHESQRVSGGHAPSTLRSARMAS